MMCCSDARNRCAEAPCQSVVLLFGINFAKLISEALAAAVVSKLNLFCCPAKKLKKLVNFGVVYGK